MKISILIPLLSLVALSSYANVESQLVNDIKKAQSVLDKTQASISLQSAKLNQRTHLVEQDVLALRKKTAAARRAVDEQTLSLTALEKRATAWQQQDTFQRNVLARFSQQQNITQQSNDLLTKQSLTLLSNHFTNMRATLNPIWRQSRVIKQDGVITQLPVLSIGPVSWFLDHDNQQAGFLVTDDNNKLQGLMLSDTHYQQLSLIEQKKSASISFDPTLTRAMKIAQAQESVLQHVEKGGIWVLPILAFGVFALLISLLKAIQLARLPSIVPALAERLNHINPAVQQQVAQLKSQVNGMQQDLLNIALTTTSGQKRDDQLFSSLLTHKHRLDYWLGAVAITAAVSPLLGLLGTVSGMIETFKLMTLFGAGDASAVSGGISEALVTTELGLVVAIPALLMHALLSRKVKTYYGALENCAVQLSQSNTTNLAEAA